MKTLITILFSFLICNNIISQEIKDNFLGCHFNMKKEDVLKELNYRKSYYIVYGDVIDVKGVSLNGYDFSFLRFSFNKMGLYKSTFVYDVTDVENDKKIFVDIKRLLENKYYDAKIKEDYFHYTDEIRTVSWVNMGKQYWLIYCDIAGDILYESENNF